MSGRLRPGNRRSEIWGSGGDYLPQKRKRLLSLSGLVLAEGFLGHGVIGHAVGAGAAAAADLMVFAHAALAFVGALVAELEEPWGLFPEFGEGRFAYVAAVQRKVAAGLELAGMADEAEAEYNKED